VAVNRQDAGMTLVLAIVIAALIILSAGLPWGLA
jgi:hypothetical protein